MADRGRWFKLWVSAPTDPKLQAMAPALRWAWAAFGCYTKDHGTAGQVKIRQGDQALAAYMGVAPEAVLETIRGFQTCDVSPETNESVSFLVTWRNWRKYQGDFSSDRVRSHRLGMSPNRNAAQRSPKKRREEKREEEKHTVSANVNGYRKDALDILEFLNRKAGRNYRPVKANLDFIEARLKGGATLDNCRGVIVRKVREWAGDAKMAKFLRPETLFNQTKFESYLGERPGEDSDA